MIGGKIWNIAYQIRKNKLNPKLIKYVNSGNISPYMELNFENLNYIYFNEHETNIVEVNPYFRYFKLFFRILDVNDERNKEFKEILFNCICHFLSETELKKGLTKEDYYLSFIAKDIEGGFFGEKIGKEFMDIFSEKEKKLLYFHILNMYRDGSSLEHFCRSLSSIFRQSLIYEYKNQEENLVIHIANKETEKNFRKFELLKEIFLPFGLKTRVFWEYHFLIIGNDGTSVIDQCKIF